MHAYALAFDKHEHNTTNLITNDPAKLARFAIVLAAELLETHEHLRPLAG